jgi:hypothetical protein
VRKLLKADKPVDLDELVVATRSTLCLVLLKKVVDDQDIFEFCSGEEDTEHRVRIVAEKLRVCRENMIQGGKSGYCFLCFVFHSFVYRSYVTL